MTKPIKTFRAGNCSASIFVNEIEREGKVIEMPKVVFDVGYKDELGQWQSTKSLDMNEIPKITLVLSKAFEWIAMKQLNTKERAQTDVGSMPAPNTD
jgi:hypothetical protein